MSEWRAPARLPRHVAIIMDGNGRWAKKRGVPRALGHRRGVEALRDIIRESSDLGIAVLSLYAFSTENWSRSSEEVGALMGLVLEFFRREIDELDRNGVCIRILGDVAGLPAPQRDAVRSAMARTARNEGLRLNIALNYGGRAELVRAARTLAAAVRRGELAPEDIDEERLAAALDTAGQLYQSAYAEFLFPSVLWPDFDREAYHQALDAYAARERRFGGRQDKGE